MSNSTLGIIGGGQLGSLLAKAAKKLNIETVILSDDINAPAKNFTKNFVCGNYEDEKIINEFISKVDLITFEFENIPYKVLKILKINFETKIISAHRTPKRMFEYAKVAEKNNISVIIAGAGGSAHLPGMVAAIKIIIEFQL